MKVFLLILLILNFGCDSRPSTDILTGDLYFSFFRLGSYYNQPDSLVRKTETYFDTLTIEKLNSGDKKVLKQYKILKENKLLFRPFVYLRIREDSVVTLYLDSLDYDKIKIYKRQNLQDDKKV